jgi:hypothetical protein
MKRILVLIFFFYSYQVFAQLGTTSDFDQKYKDKMKEAFCHDSPFADCFPMKSAQCQKRFDSVYSGCREKIIRRGPLKISDLSAEKFQNLGACIGLRLQPEGAKAKCVARPSAY